MRGSSDTNTARARAGGVVLLLALLIAGCAAPLQIDRLLSADARLPGPVELSSVPFYPQEDFQCGPAALAMVLNWSGIAVTPQQLAPEVYLPKRRGSLQPELIAAARGHGRVPYALRPEMKALIAEVVAGHPVLVLQNLAFSWYPKWHYAVVVGFDLGNDAIILRSGRIQRHLTPTRVFERTWRRAGYWAIVVMPPNELPQTAEEVRYLRSVVALEQVQRWKEAADAYRTALTRWPDSLVAQMGLGNSLYALGDLRSAEQAFRRATQSHPDAAAAFNNLAQTLADQKNWHAAEQSARRAVSLGGAQADVYKETLRNVLERATAGGL